MRLRVPRHFLQLRFLLEGLFLCVVLLVVLRSSPTAPIDPRPPPALLRGGRPLGPPLALSPRAEALLSGTAADVSAVAAQEHLLEGMLPSNVYYWWCGARPFEFKHYLSVISVLRAIRPEKIIFHYEELPVIDRNQYHTWFEDLKQDVQFFEPRPMTGPIAQAFCRGTRADKLGVILGKLTQNGGMYVSENTWILNLTPRDRIVDLDLSVGSADADGYVQMRAGLMTPGVTLGDLKRNASLVTRRGSCAAMRHLDTGTAANCLVVKGGEYDNTIFPINVIYRNDSFGSLVRSLFYGKEEIPRPVPTYDTLVPNIGHMIWIGGNKMSFVFYLSVLSMLYVVKVDVVYIHCDKPPTGEHWKALESMPRIRDRVKLISRTSPTSVYQGYIEPYYRALMSDIIRVDLMIKYGGIYTDTDAIWVKPLRHEDRGYEAVASYDWVDWTKPFPDVVNFGVSYGKRNAPFWRIFRDSMRVLHNDLHGFTGVAMPYKILEKHPDLLRIDKRLSVICYYGKCHPLWVKDYHNGDNNHLTQNSIPNWREDVHAFHWTFPDPDELSNMTSLIDGVGIFAEIGMFVLEKAGILEKKVPAG